MKQVLITKRTVYRFFNEAARHRALAARFMKVGSSGRSDTLLRIADRLEAIGNDLWSELHNKDVRSL